MRPSHPVGVARWISVLTSLSRSVKTRYFRPNVQTRPTSLFYGWFIYHRYCRCMVLILIIDNSPCRFRRFWLSAAICHIDQALIGLEEHHFLSGTCIVSCCSPISSCKAYNCSTPTLTASQIVDNCNQHLQSFSSPGFVVQQWSHLWTCKSSRDRDLAEAIFSSK